MISAAYLRKRIDYDPETGVFIWRAREGNSIGDRRWNPKWAGMQAGSLMRANGKPYMQIIVDKQHYLAHRLAWLHVHGEWPPEFIDHINGDTLDNRIANLRCATAGENSCNQKLRSNNTSGFKGVSVRPDGKWFASIRRHSKTVYLGLHPTAEAAHQAYVEAAHRLHGEFANAG